MDDGGALPRNVARKSSTPTDRSKTSKRLLSPNLTDSIINSKKSKSLLLSSNSETFHSANNSSITLNTVETDKNSEIINKTLDISENVQRHSIRDLKELHGLLNDKEDSQKYSNKRVIKVPKYTDFITNNELEKIVGVEFNAPSKKANKKSTRKEKPPDVVENELNNESNEFGLLGTMSSNKKRKKLSYEDETNSSKTNDIEIKESASSSSSVNSNTKNKVNKKTTHSRSGSASSNTKKAKVEKENNNCTLLDKQIEIEKKTMQPCVLMKYDANIEKLISEKNHTENISNTQEQTNSASNYDEHTNVFIPGMPEIKTEDDICSLNPDRIITYDLEDIKIEETSPCSLKSDISEFFSPIRDCHIHLERLSINLKVPNEKLLNSFDKIIPNCRCKGLTNIQKKSYNNVVGCAQPEQKINNCTLLSAIENAQNRFLYKSTQTQIECNSTSFNLPNAKVSQPERKALDATSNIQSKSKDSSKKSNILPYPELVRIFNSHIDAVIEEVIKKNTIEPPEKEDINKPSVRSDENKIKTTCARFLIYKEIESDKYTYSEEENKNRNDIDIESSVEVQNDKVTNKEKQNTNDVKEKSSSSRNERKTSATLNEDVSIKNTYEEKHKIKEDNKKTVTRNGRKSLEKLKEKVIRSVASFNEDNEKTRISSSRNERTSPIKLNEDISIENTHHAVSNKEDNKKTSTTSSKNEINLPVKLKEEILTEGTHHIVSNKEDTSSNNKEKHKIKEDNRKTGTKSKNPVEDTHHAVTNKEEYIIKEKNKKSRHPSPRNERKLPVKLNENILTETTENKHHVNTNKVKHRIKEENKNSTTSRNEMNLKEDILIKNTYCLETNKEDIKKATTSTRNEIELKESVSIKNTSKEDIKLSVVDSSVKLKQKQLVLKTHSTKASKQCVNLIKPKFNSHEIPSLIKEKVDPTSPQKIEPPSPQEIETTFPSFQNINNSPKQKLVTSFVPLQNATKPFFGEKPQNQECTISSLDENIIKKNLNNLSQSDESKISSNKPSSTNDTSYFDLRQVLLEKREKEKTDSSFNKYKNFIIQAPTNSNRIVCKNSEGNLLPNTLKIHPNKSTLIQVNKSPINEPNNDENKVTKSPEIKICVQGKTLVRSNSDNFDNFNKESHISEIVTQKLKKIYSERQKLEENETEIENKTKKQTQNETSNTSPQPNNNNFVFTKPKHTFKFIGKSVVKRPPTRRPSKITLKRPKLGPTLPPPQFQTVFKAPVEKKTEKKRNGHYSSNKSTMDDDIISILADTSGLESVYDAASVKNIDSDDEDDPKVNESFMDKERLTQVENWLTHSIEEPATVLEPILSPIIKKSTEIPIARVNPGVQVSKPEERSLSNESNNTERMNIGLIPEETKNERPPDNEIFKNICYAKFRKDYCNRKTCNFAHTLPNNWERILKSRSVDALMRTYNHVKNYNLMYLYKMILSVVAGQLGTFNDFNNLTNLVKDVLKIKMNTDREPLIKDIIEALIANGFSYLSTVEIIFRCVNVEQNYKNLLCDILLNLTVERKQLEDDWPIIQMLSAYKKFDIDKGIIEVIIIEALAKNYLQKELILKIYNDLIKKIPDFNMKTISPTLCQKFTVILGKYKLTSDADELLNRCISLNIVEKSHKSVNKEGILKNSLMQHEEIKSKCAIKETNLFDFPPPLITTQNKPVIVDFSKPPPNYPQYQSVQEHTNLPKQEHFVNRLPSNPQFKPQQEHHLNLPQRTLNQYQPHLSQKQEFVQHQLQKEHSNFPQSQNQYQSEHKSSSQEHLNLIQTQEKAQRQLNQYKILQEHSYQHQSESKNEYQPQQEHKNQEHLKRVFNQFQLKQEHDIHRNQSKTLPLLADLRADKGIIDQQNYAEYFRNKSYTTENHELAQQPSTSTMIEQQPTMTDDRFSFSTENLDLLANTAIQNLLGLARDGDINKTLSSPELKKFANSLLARDNKTEQIKSPVKVERHPYDDQSYAVLATNPKGHVASTVHNFSEVKQFVAEENFTSIMQLIMKYKEGNLTDAFLSHLIGALIETPHSYPTFFNTLSEMSALSNDVGLNYMLKTIGVNLVMYLCQNNQYDPAYRLNLLLTSKYKTGDFYDIYNCKIYLKNNYTFFRRILIIAQMYIFKGDISTSWNILRDNALTCGRYWQNTNNEADLKYRDFVLGKLFESFTKIKNSNIALDALLYLMKYKSTDTNIREHANSILVNVINNRCNFEKIEEFMNITPDWFQYLGKNTIRAILVTACLNRKNCVSNLYNIALDLRIYPQLMGNEKEIELDGRYHYAEFQLFLDKYFQNMVNFMPVREHIKITFTLNEETSDDDLPLLVHQYNSSKSVLVCRVAKILENVMKPPIQAFIRNNCLYLEPESVNTHLLYRQQSCL